MKKVFALFLLVIMVLSISVSALDATTRSINATVKDRCSDYTSIASVYCYGELIYYGHTGYCATTDTYEECRSVTATVYVYDNGVPVTVASDTQNNASSADASGQYENGGLNSAGYHYVVDYSGGTWRGSTAFSYGID